MRKVCLFVGVLVLSIFLQGCQTKNSGEGYEYDESLNMITGYDVSYGTDIIIPNEIDGVSIHVIGPEAFKGLGITSVEFGESIWSIEEEAFSENNIEELTVNSNMNYIGSSAFKNNQIDTLNINGVFNAGYLPFEGNPLSNKNLGDNPFMMSMFLGFGMLDDELELIKEDGYYIIPESGTIVGYDISYGTDLVIPETFYNPIHEEDLRIHEIQHYAFFDLGITSVTFSGDELLIGPYAFADNDLMEVGIDHLSYIDFGEGALRNNQLTEIISNIDYGFSRDLFRGNPITSIVIAGNEDYYQGFYQYLGLTNFTDDFESIELEIYRENVQDLSGYSSDITHNRNVLQYQDKELKFDFEIDMDSTKTSQKVDIYEINNQTETIVSSFVIPDYSYGFVDAKISQSGSIYVLAYRIPLGADSETYLPGVIIEIQSDLSTYEIHELHNNKMRIPRKLEINESGFLGVYGEVNELEDRSYLHCFIIYDDNFNQVFYYQKSGVSRFTYLESFSIGDNFILFSEGEYDGSSGSIIQVFDHNGLIRESDLNSQENEYIFHLEMIQSKIRVVTVSRDEHLSTLRIHEYDLEGNEILLKEFAFARPINILAVCEDYNDGYFIPLEYHYIDIGVNVVRFLIISSELEIEYMGEFTKYIEHPGFIIINGEIHVIEHYEEGMNIYKIIFK